MASNEKRASKRKQDILMAAAEVFHSRGYHEATLEEIANKIEYTKSSIYYYVKSKQDLLYECNKLAMELLIEKLYIIIESSISPEAKLKQAIKMHIKTAIDKLSLMSTAFLLEFALQEPYKTEIKGFRDEYERQWLSIFNEGVLNGSFKQFDQRITLFIILGAMNWMKQWYSKTGRLCEEEISEIFCNYLIPPLLKDSNSK
ncbi:MAG: hypothetical protein APF81_24525 [Desulfosporosinus sp. BRH_c37]|nr:MAG: hypothetical protein APF81_24525 [Desulfosporosinus sp. BRH_c37]